MNHAPIAVRLAFPGQSTNSLPCGLHRLTTVVTKQPAKTLSTCDRAIRGADLFSWVDKSVVKALMVPFVVVIPTPVRLICPAGLPRGESRRLLGHAAHAAAAIPGDDTKDQCDVTAKT